VQVEQISVTESSADGAVRMTAGSPVRSEQDELAVVLAAREILAGWRHPDDFDAVFDEATVYTQRPSHPGVLVTDIPGRGRWSAVFSTAQRLARQFGDGPFFVTTGADLLAQLPPGVAVMLDPGDAHRFPVLRRVARLSRLCGGEGPGLLDFQDFFGCCWSGGCGEKSGCDDLATEAGEHVQGGRLGFRPVPRRDGAAVCDVGGGVAVEVVPEDEQAVAEQPEGDGPLHGLGHPVAGLPDAQDVLHVEEGDLDAPPRRVAGDDLLGCGGEVGGDQREVIAAGGAGRASGVA